ncbi:MAG: hypothetical protein IKB64_01675 [Paludibacteraceae bacterium]|nr:hypothetical protein [Paludibacteraceae bacterium]
MFVSRSEKTAFLKADVAEACYIEPGTKISWTYKGQQVEEKINRKTGDVLREHGVVVADYEHYLVVRTPKGYNICLDKTEITTGWIKIKGFKPKIKRVYAFEYAC